MAGNPVVRLMANTAIILTFSILPILVIDVVSFYILDMKRPGYKAERFIQTSPLFGHLHKPNVADFWYRYNDGTKFWVSTNAYGFTDSERALEKSRPRIALIGDSTTQMWEVENELRPQYQIEQRLGRKYEVLNFGVRGYGTDQTYLLFEKVGLHFSPDIVIYTFCINDIHDNVVQSGKPWFKMVGDGLDLKGYPVMAATKEPTSKSLLNKLEGFLHRNSYTFRRVRPILSELKAKVVGHGYSSLDHHYDLRPFKLDYNQEDERRMEVTRRLIAKLNEAAKSAGARFLVVEGIYKPAMEDELHKEIFERWGSAFDFERVTESLEEFTRNNDIAFLSLPRLAKERTPSVGALFHPEDTMHFNGEGALFYADAVAERLESLGWIEGSLQD